MLKKKVVLLLDRNGKTDFIQGVLLFCSTVRGERLSPTLNTSENF